MQLPSIRMVLALVAALLASVNSARAQVMIESDRAPHALPPPRHPALPDFSMQERAAIYRSIITSRKEHRSTGLPSEMQVEIGTKLPEIAELYSLPQDVGAQIAAANKYKYAVWNDQVLLVDPAKKTVVDILRGYILRNYNESK